MQRRSTRKPTNGASPKFRASLKAACSPDSILSVDILGREEKTQASASAKEGIHAALLQAEAASLKSLLAEFMGPDPSEAEAAQPNADDAAAEDDAAEDAAVDTPAPPAPLAPRRSIAPAELEQLKEERGRVAEALSVLDGQAERGLDELGRLEGAKRSLGFRTLGTWLEAEGRKCRESYRSTLDETRAILDQQRADSLPPMPQPRDPVLPSSWSSRPPTSNSIARAAYLTTSPPWPDAPCSTVRNDRASACGGASLSGARGVVSTLARPHRVAQLSMAGPNAMEPRLGSPSGSASAATLPGYNPSGSPSAARLSSPSTLSSPTVNFGRGLASDRLSPPLSRRLSSPALHDSRSMGATLTSTTTSTTPHSAGGAEAARPRAAARLRVSASQPSLGLTRGGADLSHLTHGVSRNGPREYNQALAAHTHAQRPATVAGRSTGPTAVGTAIPPGLPFVPRSSLIWRRSPSTQRLATPCPPPWFVSQPAGGQLFSVISNEEAEGVSTREGGRGASRQGGGGSRHSPQSASLGLGSSPHSKQLEEEGEEEEELFWGSSPPQSPSAFELMPRDKVGSGLVAMAMAASRSFDTQQAKAQAKADLEAERARWSPSPTRPAFRSPGGASGGYQPPRPPHRKAVQPQQATLLAA